jgi:hypothetical protein
MGMGMGMGTGELWIWVTHVSIKDMNYCSPMTYVNKMETQF